MCVVFQHKYCNIHIEKIDNGKIDLFVYLRFFERSLFLWLCMLEYIFY